LEGGCALKWLFLYKNDVRFGETGAKYCAN